MASVRSMTSGRPGKIILSFALPLMIGNIFQQLYTVTDAMIVGQFLGVNGISAVGATEWMVWLMIGMVQGFTQGFAIKMSQDFGAKRYKDLRSTIFNAAILSLLITVILVVIGQLTSTSVLTILHTPEDIFEGASIYMHTMFWGIPCMMLYNFTASVLRSLGDGKTPLYAMVIGAITNIVLDLIFVTVFHWGLFGAAAATVTAQFFTGIFCLVRIAKIDLLHFSKEDIVLIPRSHIHLMKLGIPMAFQNAVISVGGMIVQAVVNKFGVIFIAGFTATNKLYGLLEVAATSYGFAMTTYTGQNVGAGELKRVRQGYRTALGIALVTSLLIALVMICGGKLILGCFISGDPQTVTDTMNIAYHYLFIMSVLLPILYYLHITRSCIQGMGNTVLPMMSGVAEFVMRTGAAMLLPMLMGQDGIFYAEIAAWAGADIVLFFSYQYCVRKLEISLSSKETITSESI